MSESLVRPKLNFIYLKKIEPISKAWIRVQGKAWGGLKAERTR